MHLAEERASVRLWLAHGGKGTRVRAAVLSGYRGRKPVCSGLEGRSSSRRERPQAGEGQGSGSGAYASTRRCFQIGHALHEGALFPSEGVDAGTIDLAEEPLDVLPVHLMETFEPDAAPPLFVLLILDALGRVVRSLGAPPHVGWRSTSAYATPRLSGGRNLRGRQPKSQPVTKTAWHPHPNGTQPTTSLRTVRRRSCSEGCDRPGNSNTRGPRRKDSGGDGVASVPWCRIHRSCFGTLTLPAHGRLIRSFDHPLATLRFRREVA